MFDIQLHVLYVLKTYTINRYVVFNLWRRYMLQFLMQPDVALLSSPVAMVRLVSLNCVRVSTSLKVSLM